MATQTKIINPDGTQGTGYIINGQTFKDAAGTQRVDAGTKVYTNGGEYTYKGNNTSVPYHETTYRDAQGFENPAYLRNGKAYTDTALTKPVEAGSIVHTQGGDYYKDTQVPHGVKIEKAYAGDNSFKYSGNNYKYYDNNGIAYVDQNYTVRVPDGAPITKNGNVYTNSSAYGLIPTHITTANEFGARSQELYDYRQKSYEAQERAIRAREQEQIAQLNARRRALDAEYEKNNQASYNAYLQSISPYGVNAEKLAALGLSDSGYAETTMARLGSAYQNAIRENGQKRADALLELDLAINSAVAEGNIQKAEALARMYSDIANDKMTANQYEAQLKMNAADAYDDNYWNKIAHEENVRQFDETTNLDREKVKLDQTKFEIKNQKEAAEVILAYRSQGYSFEQIAQIFGGVDPNTLKAVLKAVYAGA